MGVNAFGLVRVSVLSTETHVGNPAVNARAVVEAVRANPGSDVYLFPELGITGYTCGDLFGQEHLLDAAVEHTVKVADELGQLAPQAVIVVGVPVQCGGSLYNCAAVLHQGRVIGLVPKQHLPTYKEFYERRWFAPAVGREAKTVAFGQEEVPFGIDLLFDDATSGVRLGVEICEDVWSVIPPSSFQSLGGATLLLNLSASNEVVGKSDYRRDLVLNQSARCLAAYAYASCGWTESSTDLVFSGHCLIAENGSLLAESPRFQRECVVTADVDVPKLVLERNRTSSFADDYRLLPYTYRLLPVTLERRETEDLQRFVPAHPFVPSANAELRRRCDEIFNIQSCGLAKRLESAGIRRLVIGVSGGLDSTLALLAACRAVDLVGLDRKAVLGVTMPGFGTTRRTRSNAEQLMESLGVTSKTIDIRQSAFDAYHSMGHQPFGVPLSDAMGLAQFEQALQNVPIEKRQDLVFENVQARLRTFFLMSHGFVVGTGDLSEAALGWSTYNGDHMSMYNPNCSIPKTLVKFLVRYVAENLETYLGYHAELERTLLDVVGTPISPELLPPGKEGEIVQSTESSIGPYELHDFFLACMVRNGYSPAKTLYFARHAKFSREYSPAEVRQWLKVFYKRFFQNQFKRSCVPDGPKVGSVSLSPRGDWRMPSDADFRLWVEELETAKEA